MPLKRLSFVVFVLRHLGIELDGIGTLLIGPIFLYYIGNVDIEIATKAHTNKLYGNLIQFKQNPNNSY